MNKTFFSIFDWRKLMVFKRNAGENWTSNVGILFIAINEIYYRGNAMSDKELDKVADRLHIDKEELSCVMDNAVKSRIITHNRLTYRIKAMLRQEYEFDASLFIDNVIIPEEMDCKEVRSLLKEYVQYRHNLKKTQYFTPRHLTLVLKALNKRCVGNKALFIAHIRYVIDSNSVKIISYDKKFGKRNTEQALSGGNA